MVAAWELGGLGPAGAATVIPSDWLLAALHFFLRFDIVFPHAPAVVTHTSIAALREQGNAVIETQLDYSYCERAFRAQSGMSTQEWMGQSCEGVTLERYHVSALFSTPHMLTL